MIVSSAWTRRCPGIGFFQTKEDSYRQGNKCPHFPLHQKDAQNSFWGICLCTSLLEEVNRTSVRSKEQWGEKDFEVYCHLEREIQDKHGQ